MRLTLRRRHVNDSEQIHAALKRALDREFRKRIKTLRSGCELTDIHKCVDDAATLAALREQVNQIDRPSLQNLGTALASLQERTEEQDSLRLLQSDVAQVLISSDVLFGLRHCLFPAERMAVVAGRTFAGRLVAGAVFDVTAEDASHAAYSRADADRLGAALVAIDKSGGQLVAWAHSHPGTGPTASFPSVIDQRQYGEWILNYPQLVGLILTVDGHVRLWGQSVETKTVVPRLSGSGIERIDYDLYRISC